MGSHVLRHFLARMLTKRFPRLPRTLVALHLQIHGSSQNVAGENGSQFITDTAVAL